MRSSCSPIRARLRSAAGGACVLAALSLAGCGGDGDADTTAVGQPQATVAGARLVSVADAIDACVFDERDARRCTTADAVELPEGVEIGPGAGAVRVQAPSALRYRLTTRAEDGATFTLVAAPVGDRTRTCEPAGEGSCPAGGTW